MPSANNNKLSLPIWTGTATQYATITPVAGMTSQLEFYRYSKEIAGNLANVVTQYHVHLSNR